MSGEGKFLGLAAAAFFWWFFMGETPINLVRKFVGRGKRLSRSHLDGSDNIVESIDDLLAQASAVMGREVSQDAYLLARVSASENGGANAREKTAIQWVCRNDATSHGWSQWFTVTTAKGCLGRQKGRRYSTALDPCEDDLFLAEAILGGQLPDITGGSTHFIHYTGYKRFVDFLTDYPNVRQWVKNGNVPINLGGVGLLVVFVPPGNVVPDGADVILRVEELES
jgi:hypothetical protein